MLEPLRDVRRLYSVAQKVCNIEYAWVIGVAHNLDYARGLLSLFRPGYNRWCCRSYKLALNASANVLNITIELVPEPSDQVRVIPDVSRVYATQDLDE